MSADSAVRHGFVLGAAAAVNVSLGWIPKRVDVFNLTDGTVAAIGYPGILIPFAAGVVAPVVGTKIKGLTSGAIAKVRDVQLVSGTFAGGNAAGFFVADIDEVVGTFGAENFNQSNDPAGAAATSGTVTAQTEDSLYQSAAAGFVKGAGNTLITSFAGTVLLPKGFTIGSTIAAAAKRLRWTAFRD
jgi:hypothetical protein